MNISFIGYGNMAQALAAGLASHTKFKIKASAPSLKNEKDDLGVQTCSDNLSVLDDADVLILAVKPYQMEAVLDEIKNKIAQDTIIVSVAAGLSLNWYKEHGIHSSLIRAMPNIASAAGKGATPLVVSEGVNPEQKARVETIFAATGITAWVEDESKLNALTALSGSGPAYIFLFIEAMADAAVTLGIDLNTAKQFALQTATGATELALSSELEIPLLRQQVTSPGGTTEAAIDVFEEENQLHNLVREAMRAAFGRARQLSKDQSETGD